MSKMPPILIVSAAGAEPAPRIRTVAATAAVPRRPVKNFRPAIALPPCGVVASTCRRADASEASPPPLVQVQGSIP
jgi:hypothetical protein